MSTRDLTFADKIASLEQIKKQPPKASHRQMAEINEMPKSRIAHVIQQE
jgi:hypothetical protein